MTSKNELTFDESRQGTAPPQYDTVTGHGGMYPAMPAGHNMEMPSAQVPAAAPNAVYVMQNTPAPVYGPNTVRTQCPSCHASILSEVRYESSTKTHMIALILFMIACCCCIPYCMDSCKNANHHCPNCGAYLGTYAN